MHVWEEKGWELTWQAGKTISKSEEEKGIFRTCLITNTAANSFDFWKAYLGNGEYPDFVQEFYNSQKLGGGRIHCRYANIR